MKFRFSISGKLLALGGIGLFFVMVVGAAGYAATASLADANRQILDDGSALKFQMQADQAHDALRADVLASLLQHDGGADAASVHKDLDEHAGQFRSALEQLEALPLDAETRDALKDVRPALDEYLARATAIVGQAQGDKLGAQAQMGAFMVTFRKVEKEMADLSELIARRSHDIHGKSAQAARLATWSIVAAMLACAAVLLTTSLLIGRSIVTRVRRAVQIADTVVTGDLSSRIQARGNDEAAQLLQALARMNGSLVELVGTVRPASQDSATGEQHLSPHAERQGRNLQQTAASMRQVHATVRADTDGTQQANLMAVTASDSAARSGEAVQNLVATMTGITEASKRITDIIGVIDDIAFLTNILALNAAVEAARAGEQGRGFAVVATEVRTLAQRSAAAAKEIKHLIAGSIEQVTAGERQASHARDNMAVVVEQVRQMTRVLAEVTNVSAEQNNGIQDVRRAVTGIDPATRGNAPLVESAAAADSPNRQATRLVEAVSQFRLAGGTSGEQRPVLPVPGVAPAG